MTPPRGLTRFDPARSAAIEQLLLNVATEGASENKHFHTTRNQTLAVTTIGAALLVTGGAVILSQTPVTVKGDVACFARAELDGDTFPGTWVTLGIPSTTERPDSRIDIEDPAGLCADLWAQNILDPDDPYGSADPDAYDPDGTHPVPAPLAVCVMPTGQAAVIPGDKTVCADLGLALEAE
ncbi:hypothetical protein [Arthrobacter sp. Br18]|uniref:hypothetical protein n=1 Tax=Arthrobacter sp. Br18 TaxID=1312954 RepID=UPI00047C3322|nr:hypothetical protein [Arthrobacter sp. Br18]